LDFVILDHVQHADSEVINVNSDAPTFFSTEATDLKCPGVVSAVILATLESTLISSLPTQSNGSIHLNPIRPSGSSGQIGAHIETEITYRPAN